MTESKACPNNTMICVQNWDNALMRLARSDKPDEARNGKNLLEALKKVFVEPGK